MRLFPGLRVRSSRGTSSAESLPGEFGQACARNLGGGAVGIMTDDVLVQFFGVDQVGLALLELSGLEHLRRLIRAAGRAAQEQDENHPRKQSVHAAVLSLIGRKAFSLQTVPCPDLLQVAVGDKAASLRGGAFTDAIPWRDNSLTPAARTTAWAREPGSIAEDVGAVLTVRGFQEKCSRGIASQGFHNMGQVLFHLALRYAEELS